MKKTFLTAIAIFAFSFGSYANNINIDIIEQGKETEFSLELSNEDSLGKITNYNPWQVLIDLVNCSSVYQDVLEANTPIFGSEVATTIATGTFYGCMGFDPVNGW